MYENCLYPFDNPEAPIPFNNQEQPDLPDIESCDIFEAWEERVANCDNSSAALRAQAPLGLELNTQRATVTANFIRQALVADEETANQPYIMFDHEFLTCRRISCSPSLSEIPSKMLDERMDAYRQKLVDLFDKAEEKWQAYIEQAANLCCPVAIDRGTGTSLEEAKLTNRLVIHHDMWLQRLLAPMR